MNLTQVVNMIRFETFCNTPGRSAAWLARLTGGQEVGGSNPLAPNN